MGTYGIMEELIKGGVELGYIVFTDSLQNEFETCQTLQGEVHVILHEDNPLCQYDRIPFEQLYPNRLYIFQATSFYAV